MKEPYRVRRIIVVLALLSCVAGFLIINPASYEKEIVGEDENSETNIETIDIAPENSSATLATTVLEKLEVKGRAPKTGYNRSEFYASWPKVDGCSLRQIIIKREMGDTAVMDGCDVVGGSFIELYTGNEMTFSSKSEFSKKIQIDHIVALSDAWQKGAQYKTKEERYQIATDPLNLIAADSAANQQKSDGDAATWLPSNKAFRCQYVARQVSVKYKYALWVTEAEKSAIASVLEKCPKEPAIGV